MSAAPSYFAQFDNATAQWQIYQMVDALQALDDSAGDRRVNARLLCTVAEGIDAHKLAELLALGAAAQAQGPLITITDAEGNNCGGRINYVEREN